MGDSSQRSKGFSTALSAPTHPKTNSSEIQSPFSNQGPESKLPIPDADNSDVHIPQHDTRRRRRLSPLMEFASLLLLHLQAMLFIGCSAIADAWSLIETVSGIIEPIGPFFELAVLIVAPFFVSQSSPYL